MENSGSEWRKWNLHVHTKGTNKNDQFTSKTMEEFFHVFFRKAIENEVAAIGITDYFSIDRYSDALSYLADVSNKEDHEGNPIYTDEEIAKLERLFIFPNVELRMLPSTDRGKLINIHCLFNPEYLADLENDFFAHIQNADGFKMNRHGLISYGKSLETTLNTDEEYYKKGIDNFVIDLKSLKKIIQTNKKFKDNTLLVVSNSSNDGASGLQKHYDTFENESGSLDGTRISIYSTCHAVFSANQKDVKYFLGRRLEGTEGYTDEIYQKEVKEIVKLRGSLKACIVGCDAHKEDDLFSRFTWIKADLNFEGLRQICFEPESRVKIQKEKPDYKEDKYLIKKAQFLSSNDTFTSQPIFLNPNLNVIIGGKSSGKSILLYAIAKTLSADEGVLMNEDDKPKYELNEIEEGLNFEITTNGGFKQKLYRDEDERSILPQIKYIPQSYLVKLAEPELNKKGKSLDELVRDLITEDLESKDLYNSFINKVTQNDKSRNSQIDLFFEIIKEINELENELKTKSNKSVLEQNIKSNSSKLEELNKNSGLNPEEVEKYKTLQTLMEKNEEKKQHLREDLSITQNFNLELVQTIRNLKTKKDNVLNSYHLSEIKKHYTERYSGIDELYNHLLSIESELQVTTKENGNRSLVNESEFKSLLISLNAERKKLEEEIKPFLKDEDTKKIIQGLNESIANDKKALVDIENITKRVVEKRKQKDDSKLEIFKIYEENYKEYGDVILALKERTLELERDGLNIVGKAQFNYPKLRKTLYAISDGRSASYRQHEILQENKKASSEVIFSKLIEDIKIIFNDILEGKYVLTNRTDARNAIKMLLEDYFFDHWEITYKNDRLGQMSTGKASFVILMLIIGLSKSKAPILIDQPEDNLDNRSITTDLVNYLKNKKLERQIIVVTHNANIVVNADAENVIVANQKGQSDETSSSQYRFDYANGAIENSFEKKSETDILKSMGIRQHIADIIEGGKDAFLMREKKYRFS